MSIQSLLIHDIRIIRPYISKNQYNESILDYVKRAQLFDIKGRLAKEQKQLIDGKNQLISVENTVLFFVEFNFEKYDRVVILEKTYELASLASDFFDSTEKHHRKISLRELQ